MRIFITIRIGHWQNVEIEFVQDIIAITIDQPINHIRSHSMCNPLSSMDTPINPVDRTLATLTIANLQNKQMSYVNYILRYTLINVIFRPS